MEIGKLARPAPPGGSVNACAALLRQCGSAKALDQGKRFHQQLVWCQQDSMTYLGNLVVQMYGNCGRMDLALAAFNRIAIRNVYSFCILISAYAQNGHPGKAVQTFHTMELEGIAADSVAFVALCEALYMLLEQQEQEGRRPSFNLARGKEIHTRILQCGFLSTALGNALITLYRKCSSLRDAETAFRAMGRQQDVISWNSMIAGYMEQGLHRQAMHLYSELLQHPNLDPDATTFVTILGACSSLEEGRSVHTEMLLRRRAISDHPFSGNALLNMYARCGSPQQAREAFDSITAKSTVSWNTIIWAYAEHGFGPDAIRLLQEMIVTGCCEPDEVTFINALSACSVAEDLAMGKQLHAEMVLRNLMAVPRCTNAVLNMYTKCGDLQSAMVVFEGAPARDLVTWNSIIAAFAQTGHYREAFFYFSGLDLQGWKANSATLSTLVWVCAASGDLGRGRLLHSRIVSCGFDAVPVVANSLLHMYAKCGILHEARRIFDKMPEKNLIAWNTMLIGYARHGHGREAVELFQQMDIEPDEITFSSVLHACCHAGLLSEGCKYFGSMLADHGISPSEEHYITVADLLCRVGKLEDAENFLNSMPFPAPEVSWRSFIAACKHQGDINRAARAAEKLLKLEPTDSSSYVLISSIYARPGKS